MYRSEMTDDDHRELLDVLRQLPCMVMVSSYWSEFYAEALADWRLVRFQAQTRTGPAEECVWLNFPEATRLHDSRYVGKNKRQRERIRRRARNWKAALKRMPPLERQHILDAITGRHKPRRSIDCP